MLGHSWVFSHFIVFLRVREVEIFLANENKTSHLFPSLKCVLCVPSKSAHVTSATAKASSRIRQETGNEIITE